MQRADSRQHLSYPGTVGSLRLMVGATTGRIRQSPSAIGAGSSLRSWQSLTEPGSRRAGLPGQFSAPIQKWTPRVAVLNLPSGLFEYLVDSLACLFFRCGHGSSTVEGACACELRWMLWIVPAPGLCLPTRQRLYHHRRSFASSVGTGWLGGKADSL